MSGHHGQSSSPRVRKSSPNTNKQVNKNLDCGELFNIFNESGGIMTCSLKDNSCNLETHKLNKIYKKKININIINIKKQYNF